MKRSLALFALALVALVHGVGDAATQTPFDLLGWLEGDWVRQTKRGEATESWTRVSDDTLEGVVSLLSGDATTISEYLRLVRLGEEVFFIAKPSQNPLPTAFALIECSAERAVFANPDHDFPQRIIYIRSGDDSLRVRIEGAEDGETRGVDFRFARKR